MNALSFRQGWPLYAGMAVAGAAAVVASASTLAALAHTAGWSGWTPWLLPAALDIGGSAGGWCWLRPGVPDRARRFGRLVALTGAAGSLIGNAAGHLLTTHYLSAGPALVVVVGAVPAAVLVALAHLAALLADPTATSTEAEPGNTGSLRDERMFEWSEGDTSDQRPRDDSEDPNNQNHNQKDDHQEDDEQQDDREGDKPQGDHHEDDGQGDGNQRDGDKEHVDTRAVVLQLLHQHPHTIADLARSTGRSRSTVIGHLSALTKTGAIHRQDDKRYRATTGPHLITTRKRSTRSHPTTGTDRTAGPEEAVR